MLKDIIELNKARFGSYEKLAERLDIDPTVICHWKAGRRKPTTVHGDIRHLESLFFKPY